MVMVCGEYAFPRKKAFDDYSLTKIQPIKIQYNVYSTILLGKAELDFLYKAF